MPTRNLFNRLADAYDACPWDAASGRLEPRPAPRPFLYTAEQRRRRDASRWTIVQGVLAPVQFAIFLASLTLVLNYLATGEGLLLATTSVVIKTLALYAIMITGSIWERDVFGRYLFARAFFWEDVVSIVVLALHTTYLVGLLSGALDPKRQMWLALTAYATYVINAAQYLVKLRTARRESAPPMALGAAGYSKWATRRRCRLREATTARCCVSAANARSFVA
jgi:3-vinyl bacteriochlorophyllide hydratase